MTFLADLWAVYPPGFIAIALALACVLAWAVTFGPTLLKAYRWSRCCGRTDFGAVPLHRDYFTSDADRREGLH